nr:hypothetical protein [Tanacetum cinerariifolium]
MDYRNPGHRFYGCPTLSPICVNFLRWYDPPMSQRSIQIIPGLLRNELGEIVAMVMGYVAECGFVLVDGMNMFGYHEVGISKSLSESDKHTSLGEQVIIPSPADIIQTTKLCKLVDTREGGEEFVMSTQEYIRKVIKVVGKDNDFTHAPWLSAIDYVNVDGGVVTGCFGDVNKCLKNGKLKKVVAVIKSCTPNTLGDLTVTLKDLSGTISGTHYKVLTEERFTKAITVGAALILHNVYVFFFLSNQLIITKKNMVKVFHKDGGSA